MANVRDQIASAALEHGARAALSAPSLAARVVRTWVYVWLAPVVPFLMLGIYDINYRPEIPEPLAAAIVIPFFWFFPSMVVTALGMIIFAAFRYK